MNYSTNDPVNRKSGKLNWFIEGSKSILNTRMHEAPHWCKLRRTKYNRYQFIKLYSS